MSTRRREVTELEAAFFHEVLKDAEPIKHKSAKHESTPGAPPKFLRAQLKANPFPVSTPLPKAPVHFENTAPGIGGHRAAHLRKGRLEPEAKLDLHGYRQEAAYRALQRFLMSAHGMGQRVVLVVTGKGGPLRECFPRWLGEAEFQNLVSGISAAHARHGGDGAFYVALKKQRPR
jgi:DNA-nicking Smr family endonuclease